MQARTLILTSTGLTAALVLFVLLRLERAPARGAPTGERAVTAGEASRTATEIASLEPPSARAQAGRTEPDTADVPAARPEGERVALEIVQADTRAPVPEATVWWWPDPPASGEPAGLQAWLRRGQVEEHARDARVHQADRHGRVEVPAAERGFSVVAASGSLWGLASFAAEHTGPAVVALAPDADIRVQVVDPGGAPVVGAPVVLSQRRGPASFDLLSVRSQARDGIALLRHAAHCMRRAPDESFVVALQGLLDPPVERSVTRELLSGEVVRLVLAPNGSCEIVVVDERGQRVPGPLAATLSFAETGVSETLVSRTGEEVLFEHVALGRTLVARVIREGSAQPLEVRGPGPRAAGERVRLALRTGPDVAVLSGRLVDSEGKPAGERAVRVRLGATGAGLFPDGAWSQRTAADGVFAIDTAPLAEVPAGATLAVTLLSEQGTQLAVARRPLPGELRAGSQFLGDFELVELSVAAAGVVVDSGGQAIAGATITASVPLVATQDEEAEFRREPELDPCQSDAEGRFEIRGEGSSAMVSLAARRSGWVGDPLLVQRGERDVRLVLGSGGTLAGQVLLDPSLLPTLVLVQGMRHEKTESVEQVDKHGVLAADGRFSLGNLRPGGYALRVVYAPTGNVLGRVDDLLVQPGGTTRDERIDPLDLRAAFRLLELELVDGLERPVSNARAFSRPSLDPESRWAYCRAEGARLRLLSDGRPLDVAISAPGFSRTELEGVSASQRVTLQPDARLYLYLARGLGLPEPPVHLGVQLTPLEVAGFSGFTDAGVSWFEPAGTLACRTGLSGRIRVELVLQLRDGRAGPLVYLEEDAARVLTAASHPHEQAFEIAFDPARLQSALERLRGE